MALNLTATKTYEYGASVSSADRYFTFQSPASAGTASNISVSSFTGASIGAVNTNGSSSTSLWRLEIQVQLNGSWYALGYFDAGGRLYGSNTLTSLTLYNISSIYSLLGKTAITGLRGYVINGYFYTYAGCQVSLNFATAVDYSAVTAPTTVSVSLSGAQAPNTSGTLSWLGANNGDGGSNIARYEIYRSSTSSSSGFTLWQSPAGTGTSYSILTPNTNGSYWYKIKTISSVSGYDSALSSAYATVQTSFTVPTTPSGLTLAYNNVYPGRSVALSWDAVTGGTNNTFTGYQIQRATTVDGTYSVIVSSQTETTVNVSSRSENGSYFYKVIALAPYGNSEASTAIELVTIFSIPTTPDNVSLDDSNVGKSGTATLSWDASTSITNNDISGYKVERASASGGPWTVLVATQAGRTLSVVSQATNNTSYFYRVTALAPYANSEASASVELVTQWTAPTTPANLIFSKALVAPNEEVDFSWDVSTGGTNNLLTGYKVERSIYSDSGFTVLVATQAAATLKVTARSATGQSYFYRVTALAPTENSAVSAVVELAASVGPIAAPTGQLINGASSSTIAPSTAVNVTWIGSADGENNAVTGYKVYMADTVAGAYTEIGSVGATTYIFEATTIADIGTRYYKVMAVGAVSNSVLSSYASITTSLTTSEASTFTMSPTSVDGGTTTTATIVPSNVLYTHKMWITFVAETSTVGNIEAGLTTWAYEVSTDWLYQIPNALSGLATVTLETYSGTTLKGRRTSSVNITVPNTALPTLASFDGTRVDNTVPSAWGVYVVSKSQVNLVMGAGAGIYGSSITSASAYRLTGGGMNISSATPITQLSNVLANASTTFYAYITDSRGRTGTYTVSVTAEPYFAPKMTVDTFRCSNLGVESDEGLYGYVKAKCDNSGAIDEFASVDGNNSVVLSSKYRIKNTSNEYVTISSGMTSDVGIVFGGGAIAADKYYEVVYTVVDAVGTTVTFTDEISVATHLIHIKANGLGIAFGGPSTIDNTLEVHWDAKFHQDIDVYGLILKNGVALVASDVGAAATDHGLHVPTVQTADNAVYLRNDNTWQTISPADIGTDAAGTARPASDVSAWAKAATKPSYAYSEITSPPSSLPASDVSAWAKAETKPAYTYSEVGAAAASHGIHLPTLEAADNTKFLRNDGSWQTVTPTNIGAAVTSHGDHVPTPQTADNAVYLRNDNSWQTISASEVGAQTTVTYGGTVPSNAVGANGDVFIKI